MTHLDFWIVLELIIDPSSGAMNQDLIFNMGFIVPAAECLLVLRLFEGKSNHACDVKYD